MKFAWSSILYLLVIHHAEAFGHLFKKHDQEDKPSILDILRKPKIPGLNIQLGSHLGGGSFGFGFSFGGQYVPPGSGVNLPPKETVHVKPGVKWEENTRDKVGPRPNWGDEKEEYPKPGSYDDDQDYSRPGSHDEEDEQDFSKPGPLKESEEYTDTEDKDSLPDWESLGEKQPKSESMMDRDLVGDGLIQPRFNRRRSRRSIESKVYHVPLLFRSNAKPYQVKIRSHPNSFTKGD